MHDIVYQIVVMIGHMT